MASSTMDEKAFKTEFLHCLTVAAPAPWHAYLIPMEGFPTNRKSRPLLLKAISELIATLRSTKALQRAVWLLLDELHHENAVTQISRNAAIWQPDIGLGVRPENPPPRFWTGDDLLERDYGTPIPPLKHTVVMLDTNEAGAELACGLMNGIGGLIQTLSRAPLTQPRSADRPEHGRDTVRRRLFTGRTRPGRGNRPAFPASAQDAPHQPPRGRPGTGARRMAVLHAAARRPEARQRRAVHHPPA